MLEITVPGYRTYKLENLVLDFNGTIAKDGKVEDEILEDLRLLSLKLDVYVISADTNGNVRSLFEDEPAEVIVTSKENGSKEKFDLIEKLGWENTVAIGNGRIDIKMLEEAALSICVMGEEGCAREAMLNSDIIIGNREEALKLLLKTNRLVATLRG
ncbi:MAG: haloacid dehalogenase [Tissierellales bacterium]|jgi:soluble P-type ATPase|nr:haloacid dehalogenase [Tissierellales bacterium]